MRRPRDTDLSTPSVTSSMDLSKLLRSNIERKVLDTLQAKDFEANRGIGLLRSRMEQKEEMQKEIVEEQQFETFIAKRLEAEYQDTIKNDGRNFNFLYEKNKQGLLLYPPTQLKMQGWNDSDWDVERVMDKRTKFLVDPSIDEERQKLIQNSFLKEGEIQRSLIPGPFEEPMLYLGISAAFLFKFWNLLE